jgi:hypothetical protein
VVSAPSRGLVLDDVQDVGRPAPENSFRHEHFLVFLLAHFHKAALLMFSDRLTEAMSRLDAHDKTTVQSFRMASHRALETFLRFTHRYWFHSVSSQTQARDLFALCRSHLELDRLYDDLRQEIGEMSEFLENEALRRQNDTMTRLTVVTTLGLIGTTVTGFLGMNILTWADEPMPWRIGAFIAVLLPTILLTLLTIAKSRMLSNFMEYLSDAEFGTKAQKNPRPQRCEPARQQDRDQIENLDERVRRHARRLSAVPLYEQ